jgi:hypothetical protein
MAALLAKDRNVRWCPRAGCETFIKIDEKVKKKKSDKAKI